MRQESRLGSRGKCSEYGGSYGGVGASGGTRTRLVTPFEEFAAPVGRDRVRGVTSVVGAAEVGPPTNNIFRTVPRRSAAAVRAARQPRGGIASGDIGEGWLGNRNDSVFAAGRGGRQRSMRGGVVG